MSEVDPDAGIAEPIFNPFDPTHYTDPYGRLAQARALCPVAQVAPGLWFVSRNDDVRKVLRDPATYSNAGNFALDETADEEPPVVVQLDPPRHGKFRRILLPAFTPDAVHALTPFIRSVAASLVTTIKPCHHADLIDSVAVPLPSTVISHMLGVPEADRLSFQAWTSEITANLPFNFRKLPLWPDFRSFLDALIEERRAESRDDVTSTLVNAEVDGEPLAHEEVRASLFQLIVAGFETTTHLIGNCAYRLLGSPELRDRVIADLTLVPTAVEESLRLDPPIEWAMRSVLLDRELGTERVAAGDRVLIGLTSANRDETLCPRPSEFLLDRPAQDHVAFGHGIHLCLGANLARVEAAIAIETVLSALPDIRLAQGASYARCTSPMLRGPQRLDVEWS